MGTMAGGMAGPYNGTVAIPEDWPRTAENARRERDYMVRLAHSLFELWRQNRSQR